ncbi:hypothetical protein BC941DRAFT_476526 [Chlamydoabsidia padenii]|nr:hypothetical protein BC941DRAFT_476526 [Chlamydoabsidia padenii]
MNHCFLDTLFPPSRSFLKLWHAIENNVYEWDTYILAHIDGSPPTSTTYPSPNWFTAVSLQHWTFTNTTGRANKKKNTTTLFYEASTQDLRTYWLVKDSGNRQLPIPKCPFAPPPCSHMTPAIWKRFWRLKIPHNIRNCWWRILINKVSSRLALRYVAHIQVQRSSSPTVCQFCLIDVENTIHMLLLCPRKRSFWHVALPSLHINLQVEDVWDVLTFHWNLDPALLQQVSKCLLVVWQHLNTSRWWMNVQQNIIKDKKTAVLPLMLSSNATLVTGNQRQRLDRYT